MKNMACKVDIVVLVLEYQALEQINIANKCIPIFPRDKPYHQKSCFPTLSLRKQPCARQVRPALR